MLEDLKGSIRVFCRVRPIADEEILKGQKNVSETNECTAYFIRFVLLEMTTCPLQLLMHGEESSLSILIEYLVQALLKKKSSMTQAYGIVYN